MELHIMRPEWLWSILPAALLCLALWRQRRRSGSWSNVIDPALLPYLVREGGESGQRNPLPWILAAWIVAAVAASGPSWEKIPQPVHQKQDALVILLDLSYSMKSGDLAPSRTDRARQKIIDLLERRREGQTALIAYAGDSHIVTPLTDDTPTIANLLPALHPDMMPLQGSDPAAAVEQALELLRSAGIRNGTLLLISDEVTDKDAKRIRDILRKASVRLSVMGVGTATGAPIPLPRGGFVKDDNGAIVMPGLEESPLRALARQTGGSYRAITIDESDIDVLLAEQPFPDMEQTLALDRGADAWDDKGYLLVLLLLPLALALFRRGWLLSLLPILLFAQPAEVQAQAWDKLWQTRDQQAQRALQEGDAAAAADLFEHRDWAGTAAYSSGDFDSAAEHFANGDGADQWYNRGNALARAGKLDEAIEAYEQSLSRLPDQADAEENLELLKQLQEKQQNQQDQQQNQDGDNGEQQQQSRSGDQGQQQDQSDGEQQSQQGNSQNSSGDQSGADQQSGAQSEQQDSDAQRDKPGEEDGDSGEQSTERAQQGEEDGEQTRNADTAAADAEQAEKDQATEQWLRRVPDDPSGLLRQKFRYESELRRQQGKGTGNEKFW